MFFVVIVSSLKCKQYLTPYLLALGTSFLLRYWNCSTSIMANWLLIVGHIFVNFSLKDVIIFLKEKIKIEEEKGGKVHWVRMIYSLKHNKLSTTKSTGEIQ